MLGGRCDDGLHVRENEKMENIPIDRSTDATVCHRSLGGILRIHAYVICNIQGYRAEMRSLLDENLSLERRLKSANVEIDALRAASAERDAPPSTTAASNHEGTVDDHVTSLDCADFKSENQKLKDLLEKRPSRLLEKFERKTPKTKPRNFSRKGKKH